MVAAVGLALYAWEWNGFCPWSNSAGETEMDRQTEDRAPVVNQRAMPDNLVNELVWPE